MNDFSPEGSEAVIDFTAGNSRPDRRIVKRPNGGTVGKKKSSTPARFARGAAAGTVIGLVAHGVGGEVVDHVTANVDNGRAIVTVVKAEENNTKSDKSSENQLLQNPEKNNTSDLFDIVFHDLSPQQYQEARLWVADFKERIREKPGYEKEHREIPQQYKEVIREAADAYGLPFEMLYGIIAIENGGGPDITNEDSQATGVAQFLPETARQYDLKVDKNQDQRKDPVLSIDAAGRYLRDHKALLGEDIGLTIWSYHAGIGNVYNALNEYSLDKYGVGIGDYGQAIVNNDRDARIDVEKKAAELIKRDKLDYFKLISNPAVKTNIIPDLHDYSETYVPSVLALIELENEREDKEFDLGEGLKVSVPKDTFPGR